MDGVSSVLKINRHIYFGGGVPVILSAFSTDFSLAVVLFGCMARIKTHTHTHTDSRAGEKATIIRRPSTSVKCVGTARP